MTITYGLMEKFEKIMAAEPERAQLLTKARVTELLTEGGKVVGCRYEKDGATHEARGPVVLATGGFGADFSADSLLAKLRPEYMELPTTNGTHCTGDGIKMATAVGADTVDLDMVQVHPTALVHPNEPDAKVKFLAAEALRGAGGIFLDREGNRFVDELQKRDFVTGAMWAHNKGPYRLVLNGKSSKSIEWHCLHYEGRGLMKKYVGAESLAKEMGISVDAIRRTFDEINEAAEKQQDRFGRKFFVNLPLQTDDTFYVGIVTPVIHYTLGGLRCNADAQVLGKDGRPVPGLFWGGGWPAGCTGRTASGGRRCWTASSTGACPGGRPPPASCTSSPPAAPPPRARARRRSGEPSPSTPRPRASPSPSPTPPAPPSPPRRRRPGPRVPSPATPSTTSTARPTPRRRATPLPPLPP
eukprot:Sspe_Gene.979::Locus_330_Transcript_14_15_Confidence_0.149_Length_2472::g.979::m.979